MYTDPNNQATSKSARRTLLIIIVSIIALIVIAPLVILVYYFSISPSVVKLRNKLFPATSLSKQLSTLNPVKVEFPDNNWVPRDIEVDHFSDQFIVRSYSTSSRKTKLFSINKQGKIFSSLSTTESTILHGSFFEVNGVGVALDYCEIHTTCLYKIQEKEIVLVSKVPANTYELEIKETFLYVKDEINTYNLSAKTTYKYQCTKTCFPDGGCCGTKASLKIGSDEIDIQGYSRRDSATLIDGTTAIIFGVGDPSRTDDENELYIFP